MRDGDECRKLLKDTRMQRAMNPSVAIGICVAVPILQCKDTSVSYSVLVQEFGAILWGFACQERACTGNGIYER